MTAIASIPGYRYRSREEGPDNHTLVKTHNGNPFITHESVAHSQSEEISDIVTPDYHKRIKQGAIINNPCLYERVLHSETSGSYTAVRTSDSDRYDASGGSTTNYHRSISGIGYLTGANITEEAAYQASRGAKFYAISRIDTTPYAFAEDVGEVLETLKFLRSPFSSLLKLGKTFERDVFLKSKRKAKKLKLTKREESSRLFNDTVYRAELLSSAWSEYRFAAAPLIRSAMDVMEAATWYEGVTPPVRRSSRGKVLLADKVNDTYRHNHTATIYDDFDRTNSHDVDIRASILYQVSNPVQDMRWRLGLRTKDIPKTMWELLPLSFMVDRVIDIKHTIAGITNLLDPQVKILAGSVTYRSEQKSTISFVGQVNPGWVVTVNPDVEEHTWYTYTRDTWGPSFIDTVPQIKMRELTDSITKTVDLVALTLNSLSIRLY